MLYICKMPDILNIADFLVPINIAEISSDEHYHDGQVGHDISVYENAFPDLSQADIILIGCAEQRGNGPGKKLLRQMLYAGSFTNYTTGIILSKLPMLAILFTEQV